MQTTSTTASAPNQIEVEEVDPTCSTGLCIYSSSFVNAYWKLKRSIKTAHIFGIQWRSCSLSYVKQVRMVQLRVLDSDIPSTHIVATAPSNNQKYKINKQIQQVQW